MNQKEAIERVRQEASKNPAVNAVLHVWAMRQRARSQVTIRALAKTMQKEGFEFPVQDYARVVHLLAANGLGHLQRGPKGKVTGLSGIKVTLQSLGMAACGQGVTLKTFNQRTHFAKVQPPQPAQSVPDAQPMSQTPPIPAPKAPGLTLTVLIKDGPLEINIPTGMTPEAVAELIRRLRD